MANIHSQYPIELALQMASYHIENPPILPVIKSPKKSYIKMQKILFQPKKTLLLPTLLAPPRDFHFANNNTKIK